MIVVADASPLITLARASHLELLHEFYGQILIPREVHEEVTVTVTDKVDAAMVKEGVFVMSWVGHFVTGPPLIIEKSDIDFGVSVMDRALEIADQYVVA